jgi:hypothetical protein
VGRTGEAVTILLNIGRVVAGDELSGGPDAMEIADVVSSSSSGVAATRNEQKSF